jgi:hypothetical protein
MSDAQPTSRFFINSYQPLVGSAFGRAAAIEHDLPPFIDGSIRREPDLAHENPAISCLCRADKFAPRLRVGDVVGYVTVKGRYGDLKKPHWRLTSVLRVVEVLPSHKDGAKWYESRNLPLPSNCMTRGNPPNPLERSHKKFKMNHEGCGPSEHRKGMLRAWDGSYRVRAMKYPQFVVCESLFTDLSWSAPVINEEHFVDAFEKAPATQNPGSLPRQDFVRLLKLLGVSVRPSCL